MSIDNSTVKKVAKLARIKIDPKEEHSLKCELNNILEWVDKLQKVDTKKVVFKNTPIEIYEVIF